MRTATFAPFRANPSTFAKTNYTTVPGGHKPLVVVGGMPLRRAIIQRRLDRMPPSHMRPCGSTL